MPSPVSGQPQQATQRIERRKIMVLYIMAGAMLFTGVFAFLYGR